MLALDPYEELNDIDDEGDCAGHAVTLTTPGAALSQSHGSTVGTYETYISIYPRCPPSTPIAKTPTARLNTLLHGSTSTPHCPQVLSTCQHPPIFAQSQTALIAACSRFPRLGIRMPQAANAALESLR